MRLLSLGASDAYLEAWLLQHFPDAHVDAVELNEEAAQVARGRVSGEVKVGRAEDAPDLFHAGTYDMVLGFEIIEHVPDVASFLDALEAMLKPGGRVLLSTPDGRFGTGSNPLHLRALRAVDLADLCRRRGTLLDLDVGSDAIVAAAYTPAPRREDVGIYLGPCWAPWHPTDIATKGLGGSETAAVRLAEALSDLGFVVTVYGHTEHVAYRQVIFRPHEAFDPCEPRGALICSRVPEVGDRLIKARAKLLWLHDCDAGPRLTPRRAESFDAILGLSDWHVRHLRGRYPFAAHKVIQTRNGIELGYHHPKPWTQRAPRVVYSSSPDRGLDVLLEEWPRVRAAVPDAELVFCYPDVYDAVAEQDPAVAKHRDGIRALADQPGVTRLGALPQPELAKLLADSRVWAHPSWMTMHDAAFHETSCLSGDTLIDMPRNYRAHPDGVPISELEGESGFPVWAWDESTHRFTIATANRVWKSRENAKTIRIHTDEGTTLTCTPDHKVLTFDGDWVEAGTLEPGDRLRGLNYRFQVNVNLGDGRWTGEHRVVGEWMEGRPLESDEHVHHLGDPTRLDNRPEALEVLPAGEHHSKTHKGREYSREWKAKRRALSLAWKETPEGKAHYHRNATAAGNNLWAKVQAMTEEEREAFLRDRSKKSTATQRANVEALRPEEQDARRAALRQRGRKGVQAQRDAIAAMTEDELAAHKAKMTARALKANAARWHGDEAQEAPGNHRVLSIEDGPTVDVYDMEVEEHHNFVAGGVVVHNCIAAMEAQAAGCCVVASGWGALQETVKWGSLVNSDPPNARWRDALVKCIIEGLTDQAHGDRAVYQGPRRMADMGWEGVAVQVGQMIAEDVRGARAHGG